MLSLHLAKQQSHLQQSLSLLHSQSPTRFTAKQTAHTVLALQLLTTRALTMSTLSHSSQAHLQEMEQVTMLANMVFALARHLHHQTTTLLLMSKTLHHTPSQFQQRQSTLQTLTSQASTATTKSMTAQQKQSLQKATRQISLIFQVNLHLLTIK